MEIKKRMPGITAFAVFVMLLAGCTSGSYISIKSVENNTSASMAMSYEYFDGYKAKALELSEGQTCTITAEIVSESGELGLSVTDADGNSYYTGNELPTSTFSVGLDKAGKYTVRVDAQKHKGSYDISWEIQ